MLQSCQQVLDQSVHPSAISDALLVGQQKAVEILRGMSLPIDLNDREALISAAVTSLNSKVVSTNSSALAPLAVDAVMQTVDLSGAQNVDLSNIKVVKKLGGTVEDTELINGLLFDQPASHSAGGPTRVQGAKIGLIQYCLSAPKTNMENSVIVDDYQQIDRILKEERAYILNLLKPIIKSGCNTLLIQKSILRDAVNELSLHYLAKKNIMVIKDIDRTEIEFIANVRLVPLEVFCCLTPF